MNTLNRREVLYLSATPALLFSLAASGRMAGDTVTSKTAESNAFPMNQTASDRLIFPGLWRPNCPFEQIAWVRTPWCSALLPDFVFLDFPEAIFCDQGLLYLSHVNPEYQQIFPDLPRVPWRRVDGGLSFERRLPNGVRFGGSLIVREGSAPVAALVELMLFIDNKGKLPVREIRLQTCALLKHCTEFHDNTLDNKFVRVDSKWMTLPQAQQATASGKFHVGWRGGPSVVDLPVLVTKSSQAARLIAMTWYDDTYSLIGNPHHPCMHADPCFPDLLPDARAEISGQLVFFDGSLSQFGEWFERHQQKLEASKGEGEVKYATNAD